jgi:AcrR family transcriptional regulator
MAVDHVIESLLQLCIHQASSPSPQHTDADPEGRANQKRRTRQTLVDAALALRDEGRDPTLAEVAERALVSRATAYRCFPSVEALASETVTDRGMRPLDRIRRIGDDPVEAIGRAAHALDNLLAADEAGLYVMERSFMTAWLKSAARDAPPRPGRCMHYIEPIVDALAGMLKPAARKRLKHARAFVRQALAEAGQDV